MLPEIYIVRIYRRKSRDPRQLVGLVETPGGSRIARFASLADLSAILGTPRTHLKSRARDDKPPDRK